MTLLATVCTIKTEYHTHIMTSRTCANIEKYQMISMTRWQRVIKIDFLHQLHSNNYTSYTQTTAQNWKTGKLFAVCLASIKTRLLGTQMRLRENILHPITDPPYRTEAPSPLRLAADTFKLHNMWIIAMFYQGIKQVWRKLCTSCTSQVSWQNACINSGLVNTVKTSAPIKHFYEVKGRINRFCTAAPGMCAVSFFAAAVAREPNVRSISSQTKHLCDVSKRKKRERKRNGRWSTRCLNTLMLIIYHILVRCVEVLLYKKRGPLCS